MIIPGSFKTLVNFYSVCAWLFYFLAVLALIVLRFKEPELKRPYKVWLSTPILFCIVALFLFVMPFIEAPMESFAALGFTALAVPFWLVRVKYGEQVGLFWEGKSYSFKSEILLRSHHVNVLDFYRISFEIKLPQSVWLSSMASHPLLEAWRRELREAAYDGRGWRRLKEIVFPQTTVSYCINRYEPNNVRDISRTQLLNVEKVFSSCYKISHINHYFHPIFF